MKTRSNSLPLLAISVIFLGWIHPALTSARDRGFGAVVQAVSTTYHARQNYRFVTWFAGMATKFARPEGVKSLRMAIFEDQDFSPQGGEEGLDQALQNALEPEWKPFVRVNSKRDGERTCIYAREKGKDIRLFIIALERSEAVVMELKMSEKKFAEMMDDPANISGSLRIDPQKECSRPAAQEASSEPAKLQHREEDAAENP